MDGYMDAWVDTWIDMDRWCKPVWMERWMMAMSGLLNKSTISKKLGSVAFYSINETGIDTLSQVDGWKHGCRDE